MNSNMETDDLKPAKNTAATPVALDGGYGWVVVAASFLAYFIADGWAYSFGIFYPEILQVFHESKGKTALIGALLYGVPLLISPVVCALTSIYGCRIVCIAGGIITGVSFILSSFATSVDFMCLTTGTLSSVGLSMTYIPALLIVTFYFEKRRGLATGLAVTGSGLGAFAFPPLMEHLISIYAWRGMLLILGAICFNIVIAGALFRPAPMSKPEVEDRERQSSEVRNVPQEYLKIKAGNVIMPRLHIAPRTNTSISLENLSSKPKVEYRYRSTLSLKSIHLFSSKRNKNQSVTQENVRLGLPEDITLSSPEIYHASNGVYNATVEADTEGSRSSLCSFWNELKTIMSSMMDKSLLNNWPYLLLWASCFILFLWAGMPYVYLVDKAIEVNISSAHAAFLMSIIGISRTIGQLLLGYLGDHPKINTVQLYAISIAIAGLATIFVPFCNIYATLSMYCVIFGFFISVTYCLTMMVVVDIVGLSRTTNAFGMLQLAMGISTLLGTPVAGWLYDATGNYNPSFYTAGAWIFLSGVMLLPLPRSCWLQREEQVEQPRIEEALI